jgi:hypothetical protein
VERSNAERAGPFPDGTVVASPEHAARHEVRAKTIDVRARFITIPPASFPDFR